MVLNIADYKSEILVKMIRKLKEQRSGLNYLRIKYSVKANFSSGVFVRVGRNFFYTHNMFAGSLEHTISRSVRKITC